MKQKLTSLFSVLFVMVCLSTATFAQPMTAEAASVKITCSKSVAKNSINKITVSGKKNTRYYIRIKCPKGSWSRSKTVCGKNASKKTNSKGKAVWNFKVGGGSTSKGTYKIYIYTDKSHKKVAATKTFKVK